MARWITLRGKFWSSDSNDRCMLLDLSQVQFVTTARVNTYSYEHVPSVYIHVVHRSIDWLCADEDEQKRRYCWLVDKLTMPMCSDTAPSPIEEIANNLEDI